MAYSFFLQIKADSPMKSSAASDVYKRQAIGEYLIVEIQVPCTQAKDKDDPAPAGNAHYDLKEHVYHSQFGRSVAEQYTCC